MKTRYALLSMVLTIAVTLPMIGQDTHGDTAKTEMKRPDRSSMLGKPTVDATVEGLHMKVWLMTQKQHKELMKGKMGRMMMHGEQETAMQRVGMKDTSMGMSKDMKEMKRDDMGMSKAVMDSMMAGTHHIILEATDASLGEQIADASAKILIVSPSHYNARVDLKPMMGLFHGALSLTEKGIYVIAVSVNVGGVSKTKEFEYSLK